MRTLRLGTLAACLAAASSFALACDPATTTSAASADAKAPDHDAAIGPRDDASVAPDVRETERDGASPAPAAPASPEASAPLSPTGLDARVGPQTCVAPARPVDATGVNLEEVFPRGTFSQPIDLAFAPGDRATFYVAERPGRIRRATGGGVPRTFFEMPAGTINAAGEGGFLGFAFHPAWARGRREVLVSYTVRGTSTPMRSIIARVRSTNGGDTLDAATLETLLSVDQPYTNHNGGGIAFGPDGLLYIAIGDGGAGGDPLNAGQRTDTLLGKFLRIDVDRTEVPLPYGIPPTNPFATSATERREIYAWGLRNPWRWSFDRGTGALWAGDVGQDRVEEIDLITRGGNYGWKVREGDRCYPGGDDRCSRLGFVEPVLTYGRADGVSVTGGYVYRGSRIPALVGAYVFGDYATGAIWALEDNGRTRDKRLLARLGVNNLASFGQDPNGEVYTLSIGTGAVHTLAPAAPPAPSTFPKLLSQTGCVDPRAPKAPAPSLVPYATLATLWSDGAEKERYVALPDGARIEVDAQGDMRFPRGTVLVKHFDIGATRVETRLYVHHTDGVWAGYSYRWNDEQTDAQLLLAGETREVAGTSWIYPSRSDCHRCHTEAAGFALGLEVPQLDHGFRYAATGRTANQLDTLAAIGVVDAAGVASRSKAIVAPFGNESLEARARSYLHANCSSCHQPNGGGRSDLDLRITTPLSRAALCGAPATTDTLGLTDARILAPGEPERSTLLARMRATDGRRMPPLASSRVDDAGAALVEAWIRSLSRCP